MEDEWKADFFVSYLADDVKKYFVDGHTAGYQPFRSLTAAYKAMMDTITDLTLEGHKVIHAEVTTKKYSEMENES